MFTEVVYTQANNPAILNMQIIITKKTNVLKQKTKVYAKYSLQKHLLVLGKGEKYRQWVLRLDVMVSKLDWLVSEFDLH